VMIRRAGGLSEPIMTGQPSGTKQVAIASARTPAQSRNVTPARTRTSRSIRSSRTRAGTLRELASRQKVQRADQDQRADHSIADGLDRKIIGIHRFSISSRGLDDTK
jgi:hypothetical protein